MPIKINSTNYKSYVSETSNILLDFTAEWCGPCKRMKPELKKAENFLADTNCNVVFAEIDVDESSDIAEQYGINCMPTLVLIKDGKPVVVSTDKNGNPLTTVSGAMNCEKILLLIGREARKAFSRCNLVWYPTQIRRNLYRLCTFLHLFKIVFC